MNRILLANHSLIQYAGSELTVLDVATEFKGRGWEVIVASFEYGGQLKPHFDELGIKWIDLSAPGIVGDLTVDVVWAHHFTTIDACIKKFAISAKHIVFSSLSPFEPLECPPDYAESLSLLLANSPETREALIGYGINQSLIDIFPNPAPMACFVSAKGKHRGVLSRVAIISNHVPVELYGAGRSLEESGHDVVFYGMGHNYIKIEPDILFEYDAIITIGRTVQQCLALGVPVFCYDRFGGPGYITPGNIERAAHFNFSGRCTRDKKSADEISKCIIEGFSSVVAFRAKLRAYARKKFHLPGVIDRILDRLDHCAPIQSASLGMRSLYKRQQRYFNTLLGGRIQLFFDLGAGFNESQSIHHECIGLGMHEINFDLSETLGLHGLRLDPLDNYVHLDVLQIEVFLLDGSIDLIPKIESNAHIVEGVSYIFLTDDPQICFLNQSSDTLSNARFLRVRLNYRAIGLQVAKESNDRAMQGFATNIERLESTISAERDLIGELRPVITERDKEIGSLIQKLADQSENFDVREQQLSKELLDARNSVEREIAQQMSALAEQQAQREQALRGAIEARERDLRQSQHESLERQRVLEAEMAQTKLNARDEVDAQLRALAERERAFAEQLTQLQQAASQERASLMDHYSRLLFDLNTKLSVIQTSWTWRLTAPFRSFFLPFGIKPDFSPIDPHQLSSLTAAEQKATAINPEVDSFKYYMPTSAGKEKQNISTVQYSRKKILAAGTLDELLAYEGEAFVTCAYLTLLGRTPEPQGRSYYLDCLRKSGDKLEVISQIYRSREARKVNSSIAGLTATTMRLQQWKQTPILGVLISLIMRYPTTHQSLNNLRRIEDRIVDLGVELTALSQEVQKVPEKVLKPNVEPQVDEMFKSFDANVYLRKNPDVATTGMNPYEHWVVAGFSERREFKQVPMLPPARAVVQFESSASMKNADGSWEWIDYTSVKLRIDEVKHATRSQFSPDVMPLIKIDDRNYKSVIAELQFPAAGVKPDVSIVLPVYNNLLLTLECLASIVKHTGSVLSYEIIIADDASIDDTQAVIASMPNIKYIRNESNLGFLKNCNHALEYVRGDYVVFLNNDAQVTNNWLDILKSTFNNQDNVGAVGPRFLYPNGYLQEAGAAFRYDGTADMVGLNEDPSQSRYSYARRVDYVSGACLMMPRELAMALNGFSKDYLPCYCEDSDLCLRIQDAGYHVYVNPAATIIHHLSKTTESIDSNFKRRSVNKNLAVLRRKWLPHFESKRAKIIAFYLPQYHPFPENDKWWGTGFTEWSNVAKAKPNFVGHYQPRLPADLGFYDLRVHEIMQKQAELAMRYGVGGFCFYYYWFGGKRLLDSPIEQMLAGDKPDFPFCLCWANENWTRKWDGQDNEVLIAQSHSKSDDVNVINDLIRYFVDKRYIRIDGRPLLLVYRVTLFPNFLETTKVWREICREQGVGEIYISMVESFELVNNGINPSEFGCNAAVEFPPQGLAEQTAPSGELVNPDFSGHIGDYRDLAVRYATRVQPAYTRFRGVIPGWDNTARRQNNSFCFENASPGAFQAWLEEALEQTRLQNYGDERLVFVNAWNEWAEGAYLEPDRIFGHAFLQAVKNALESSELLRKD